MYKALIIDDEKPVRQVIKALGMWQEMKVEHVFEAFEGESALEIMRQSFPEIIFVDMKMPNMNGVEFLKTAVKEFPGCKYIVISGYEDFEYTKQAINAKVLDYLLKPVNEEELNKVLRSAVDELDREKEQKIESIRKGIEKNVSIPLARERIITIVLESDGQVSLSGEEKKILGISNYCGYYGAAVFNILNLEQVCGSTFKGDKQAAFFGIINVINEEASSWSRGFSFKNGSAGNEVILVIMASGAGEEDFEQEVTEKTGRIIRKLEELFGTYCIAGIGKIVRDFDLLQKSYQTALEILHNVNILHCKEKVFTKWDSESKNKRISMMDKRDMLIYAFESGSMEYVRSIINEYFDNIRAQGYLSSEDLYKTAMEFILIIENITEQLGISEINSHDRILGNARAVKSFTHLEELGEFVFRVVEQLFGCVKLNLKASEKTNLYEIRDYIHKNFNKEIKLSFFSSQYYVSKEYLSKQFKAEFGYGIYEYVLKVRMKKAEEMITGTDVKIQQISDYLGYKDKNYFSKAFKNYFGKYPSEYRGKE